MPQSSKVLFFVSLALCLSLSHFLLKVCVMLKIRCNYAYLECSKQNENIRFSIQAVFFFLSVYWRISKRTKAERELIQTQQTIRSNGKYFNRLYKPCIQIFQVASISFFFFTSLFLFLLHSIFPTHALHCIAFSRYSDSAR